MKTLATLAILLLACMPVSAQTSLSKAKVVIKDLKTELIATQAQLTTTTENLTSAKAEAGAAQSKATELDIQITKLGVDRDAGWESSEKYQKAFQIEQSARIQTGRERDIFLLAFAIAAAVAATSFARPILAILTPPWGMAAYCAVIAGTFAASFYLGRLVVSMIVHAIFRI